MAARHWLVAELITATARRSGATVALQTPRPRVTAKYSSPNDFWIASGISRRLNTEAGTAFVATARSDAPPYIPIPAPTPAHPFPSPLPPPIPTSKLLRDLTKRIRATDRTTALTPSTLLSHITPPPPPSDPPPSPPPPIPLLPDPHRPNPHFIGAFWLQCLFLGASALGLLARRKKPGPLESRGEKEERMENRKAADEMEINLLLSCYVPWPEDDDPTTRTPWLQMSTTSVSKSLSAITAAINSFEKMGCKPDRWTVLSIMSFVSALPSTTSSPPTKVDLARPILTIWAWRAFLDLPSSPSTTQIDLSLITAFVDYLAHPPPFSHDLSAELLSSLAHRLTSHPPLPLPTPPPPPPLALNPYPSLLQTLIPLALETKNLESILSLISLSSSLPPSLKVDLSVHALEMIAEDEEWRNTREIVRDVGEAFAAAVRAEFGCEQRGWTRKIRPEKVRLDEQGPEAVEINRLDSEGAGTTLPKRRKKKEIDRIRRGIDLLRSAYRVDVPLEDLYADATLVLITCSPQSLPDNWLLTILRSLVFSRHPRLSLALFLSIPSSSLSLDHFDALIRTHHLPTSTFVFLKLLKHPTLQPTTETFHSRLISLSHRQNLEIEEAHDSLRRMKQRGLERDGKTWNLLLKILARGGSERELFRNWVRMERSGVRPDKRSWGILLSRSTMSSEGGKRTVRNGAGRSGARQIKNVIKRLEEIGKENVGPVGSNIVLRSLTRWTDEVKTDHLLKLIHSVLSIDLSQIEISERDPFEGRKEEAIPSREEWEEERNPAYKIFLKALNNRGEKVMRRKLVWCRAVDEAAVRRKERREEDWELEEGEMVACQVMEG
ncbi:hypothetical protein P7C70_g5230, partial [Phenoliferia sp. Uapishka_3]